MTSPTSRGSHNVSSGILDETSIEAKGQEIFDKVWQVASGAHTKSEDLDEDLGEDLGYGDLEFVPWQIGAVM